MPELPEVQTIINDLNDSGITGKRILRAETDWPGMITSCSRSAFCRQMSDVRINEVWRRGKFLVFDLPGRVLLIHLRMSGRINLVAADAPRSKHEHLILFLDDGCELRLHDTRKFGRVYLVENEDDVLGTLGMEPLGVDFKYVAFATELKRRKRMIKPLIMDQKFIAGLGNIYADESLWEARIHPQCQAHSLSDADMRALWSAIPRVLKRGLKNGGTSLGEGIGNYSSIAGRRGENMVALKVYGRTELPCKRCGTPIKRIVVGQRSSHFCPVCQN
jgi:formamidopyrimidine-DNA glycosylase